MMGVLESKRFFAITIHLEGVSYSQRLIGHALKTACIDLCQSGVGLDCKGWAPLIETPQGLPWLVAGSNSDFQRPLIPPVVPIG